MFTTSKPLYRRKTVAKQFMLVVSAAMCCFISSCTVHGNTGNDNANIMLNGAGSTFANPIYSKMIETYAGQTGTETSYESIGSSAGIKKLMGRTVDFGASDAFLSNDEMNMFPANIVQFPTCLGAVVITYNLPGNPELKLSPEAISGIFMGTITKWNDKKIADENPDVKLPDENITVVHRADGSGTSYIFSDYLSKISEDCKKAIGVSKTPDWPVGASGNGNEGVSGIIKLTPGAIGYVEMVYALQKYMGFALIKNASGKYIKASLESTTAAADVDLPADMRLSITNSSAPDAYPISSFTWIMLYKEQDYNNRGQDRASSLVKELWWMVHQDGQQYTKPLNYAPLPQKAVVAAERVLKSVTFDGHPLIQQ